MRDLGRRLPAPPARLVAPIVLDGTNNGDWFEAHVTLVLVPELRPGDIVIMAQFSNHKRAAVKEKTEAVGATLRFLRPYSSDLNQIERAFPRRKAGLRKIVSAPFAACGT
jgi:transposase